MSQYGARIALAGGAFVGLNAWMYYKSESSKARFLNDPTPVPLGTLVRKVCGAG
jgi:hypothetical protein